MSKVRSIAMDRRTRLPVDVPHFDGLSTTLADYPTTPARMANGHTLLDAVCEAPDDDGPRLIYADLLDERGDPRGEFIRVQLALAKLPPADPRRPELIAREKELLDDHRDEWLAPFRRLVSAAEFRRGFVEDVKVSVWHFVAFADALFATGPVRRAHLLDIHPAEGLRVLQVVLESPHVARLTGLTI